MKALSVSLVAIVSLLFLACEVAAQEKSIENRRALNGIEMYYEETGEGSPLVLLHFFGGCGSVWQPHVSRLAQHYRLIIPDLRAHGRSTNPSGEFSHRLAAADVFALLDDLGIDRFRAMGISSGGMTLIRMATEQPERIEALVLIGATPYFPEQARAIMRGTTFENAPESELDMMRACASRGDVQVKEQIELFRGMNDSVDDMNFTPPYLATISARTLIVHGDRDEFFSVEIPVGMYQAIPDSYLWIVPNGDHVPVFEDRAESFLDTVLPFLGGEWSRR